MSVPPIIFFRMSKGGKKLNFSHQKRLHFYSTLIKHSSPISVSNSNGCPKAINHLNVFS